MMVISQNRPPQQSVNTELLDEMLVQLSCFSVLCLMKRAIQ